MRRMTWRGAALILVGILAGIGLPLPASAVAQEIIVTAQRRPVNNYDGSYVGGVIAPMKPVITLKRTADYVVQPVRLSGDTRDAAARRAEIETTLRAVMADAAKAGVELATGDYVVQPLTAENYKKLTYGTDGRPDTSATTFLVKLRLTPGMTMEAATDRISRFVAAVKKEGRTSLTLNGVATLSVVDPDQYRGAIIDLIAADARTSAAKFGPAYGVDVSGLDRPVEWARAGPTEVYLYLPASYSVRKP